MESFFTHRRPHRGGSGSIAILEEGAIPEADSILAGGGRLTMRPGFRTAVALLDADTWVDPDTQVRLYGISESAINLVAADMSLWDTTFNSGSSITRSGGTNGEWQFDMVSLASLGGCSVYMDNTGITKATGNMQLEYKITAGVGTDLIIQCDAGTAIGPNLRGLVADGEWHEVALAPTSAKATMRIKLLGTSDGGTVGDQSVTLHIRDPLMTDTFEKRPPFSVNSAQYASYDEDRVEVLGATMSWPAVGTSATFLRPYGWPLDPSDDILSARAWATNNFDMRTNTQGSWLFDGGPNATAELCAPGDDVVQMLYGNWDGVDINCHVEPQNANPGTAVDATTPTGDLTLGNNVAGTRSCHGIMAFLLYDRILPGAEELEIYELMRNVPSTPAVLEDDVGNTIVDDDGNTLIA